MPINKFMMAAIKALSYTEIDYKTERALHSLNAPKIKLLYKMWDHVIETGNHEIPVRLFMPKIKTSPEVFIFFHGGGWVTGNIDTYTKPCANLANITGRRVISVDYRLAPEYPFPCAVDDCYNATREILKFCELLEITENDFILIGDSAGGNLAAVVSLKARDTGEFKIKRQILIYPALYNDYTEKSPFTSVHENGSDYLLTCKKIRDYLDLYIQNPVHLYDPYFAPLLADDFSNQPDTLILTAEYDPLRDEAEEYGYRLYAAKNSVKMYRLNDALHGFFTLPARFAHVKQTFDIINSFLGENKRKGDPND